jgi:hypothetical protein
MDVPYFRRMQLLDYGDHLDIGVFMNKKLILNNLEVFHNGTTKP